MPEGQLSVVHGRKIVCWLIQALVNVGRNYNGPKVLHLNESSNAKRTRTVVENDKQLIKIFQEPF